MHNRTVDYLYKKESNYKLFLAINNMKIRIKYWLPKILYSACGSGVARLLTRVLETRRQQL
jgi:hypothetical protein